MKSKIIMLVMSVLVIAGTALGIAGSFLLATDNAMYDYYQQTNRQFWGWLLCFVPACLALLAAAARFFRDKLPPVTGIASVCVMIVSAILPFVYIIAFGFDSESIALVLILVAAVVFVVYAAWAAFMHFYVGNKSQS